MMDWEEGVTSYFQPEKCPQCNKPKSLQTPPVSEEQETKQNNRAFTRKLSSIFKSILLSCCCCGCHQRTLKSKNKTRGSSAADNNHCSTSSTVDTATCHCHNSLSLSSAGSATLVGDGPQQPWLVPQDYHKSMSGNHWMFRTGWTPQPDPLALVNTGWCSNCGNCVRRDQLQCQFCQAKPLTFSVARRASNAEL